MWLANVPHTICCVWLLFSLLLLSSFFFFLLKNHHHTIKPIKTNFSKTLVSWLRYSNLWLFLKHDDKTFWLAGGGLFIQSVHFIHYGYCLLIFMPCQWHILSEINKYNAYYQCVKLKKYFHSLTYKKVLTHFWNLLSNHFTSVPKANRHNANSLLEFRNATR